MKHTNDITCPCHPQRDPLSVKVLKHYTDHPERRRYYTCDSQAEEMTAVSVEEAVREYLAADTIEAVPETLIVYEWVTQCIDRSGLHPLEHVLDLLDDDYADPNGTPTRPSEAMKAAEATFLSAIIAEYEVWSCEFARYFEVKLADFL